MKVAIDAMGGDFAPVEVVKGTLLVAAEQPEVGLVLVGEEGIVGAELAKHGPCPANVEVRHASEVVEMDESPIAAVRKKKDSSLSVAGRMVRSGEADATVSAGNTGAAMAVATFEIRRIHGIIRPAIATFIPARTGGFLLVDAGANVDCTPEQLVQFALVGSIYWQRVMGVESPKVGLLNIGSEAGKGNELAKATYNRLLDAPLNFIGNIEGKEAYEGAADVVVCDGFIGNVFLKASEGIALQVLKFLQSELATDPNIGVMIPTLKRLKAKFDYSEYGGAPLLGVDGVSIIAHGGSHAYAIANAIRAAIRAAESNYVSAIRERLPRLDEANP